MLLNIGKFGFVSLFLLSGNVFALTSAHFGSVVDTGDNFNQFSVLTDNVTINVSGWSDTAKFSGTNTNQVTGDDKIVKARDFDSNGNGWSMENKDEAKSDGTQKTWVQGYSHSADNLSDGTQDYDTFLLTFSEEVNLASANYSWIFDDGDSSTGTATQGNQVTVAALSDSALLNKSWAQVVNSQTISSGFSQMQNSTQTGYYTDFNTVSGNVAGVYSQYWLIGALNSAFGGSHSMEGNDGMKLAGITFNKASNTSTAVPEPSSILMFGLSIIGFIANRRRNNCK